MNRVVFHICGKCLDFGGGILACYQKGLVFTRLGQQSMQGWKGRNDFGHGCRNPAYLVQKRLHAAHNDKKVARNLSLIHI